MPVFQCNLWIVSCVMYTVCKSNKLLKTWETRKHGEAQRDGRPLDGSVLPPIECYRLVNASPLNYGQWVGQNSSLIFSRWCTKVHQMKSACAELSVVSNAVFRLTISCWVWEIFVIKSQSCAKSCQNLMFLSHQISGEGVTQIFDRIL